MNSKELECYVMDTVIKLVDSGKLGLDPSCCNIHQGKRYYSRERKGYIQVDVSIELIPPGGSKATLIWVWECKNYAGPIRVGDVERFSSELSQIGADRTKGTMVTTGYYQKGAIEFAKAKGIGLTRWRPEGTIQINNRIGMFMPISNTKFVQAELSSPEKMCSIKIGLHQKSGKCLSSYWFALTTKGEPVHSHALADFIVGEIAEIR
ncbi:MAG: restriction endonuclease [Planctomycetota bacterium]|jgi:hypothetical protein